MLFTLGCETRLKGCATQIRTPVTACVNAWPRRFTPVVKCWGGGNYFLGIQSTPESPRSVRPQSPRFQLPPHNHYHIPRIESLLLKLDQMKWIVGVWYMGLLHARGPGFKSRKGPLSSYLIKIWLLGGWLKKCDQTTKTQWCVNNSKPFREILQITAIIDLATNRVFINIINIIFINGPEIILFHTTLCVAWGCPY